MPPATIQAFRDHGKVAATLDRGYEEADATIDGLGSLGISLKSITDTLLEDGLVIFQKSYDELVSGIETKMKSLHPASAAPGA